MKFVDTIQLNESAYRAPKSVRKVTTMASVARSPFRNTLAGQTSSAAEAATTQTDNVVDKAATSARPKKSLKSTTMTGQAISPDAVVNKTSTAAKAGKASKTAPKPTQPTASNNTTDTIATQSALPEIKNLMTARAMDLKPHLQNWGLSTTGSRDELAVRYLLHSLDDSTGKDFSDQKWQTRGMELLVATNMTRLKEMLAEKGLDTKGKVKHEVVGRLIGAEWDEENAEDEEQAEDEERDLDLEAEMEAALEAGSEAEVEERDLDLEAELEAALEAESEAEDGEHGEGVGDDDDDARSSDVASGSSHHRETAGSSSGWKRKRDDPALSDPEDEAGNTSDYESVRTSGDPTSSEDEDSSDDDPENASETEKPHPKRQKFRDYSLSPHIRNGFANPPFIKATKDRPAGYAWKKPALVAKLFPLTRSRMQITSEESSADESNTESAAETRDGSENTEAVGSPPITCDASTRAAPPSGSLKRKREGTSDDSSGEEANGEDGLSSKRRKRDGSSNPPSGDRNNTTSSRARRELKAKVTKRKPMEQRQKEDHYAVFGTHLKPECLDTRVLFENTSVSGQIICTIGRILTGRAKETDATDVYNVRAALPIYKAYCEGKFKAKSEADSKWLATQHYWESREMEAVRLSTGDE